MFSCRQRISFAETYLSPLQKVLKVIEQTLWSGQLESMISFSVASNIQLRRTWQNHQDGMCAQRRVFDAPSLIRVFDAHMKKAWILSYPLSAQRRRWSDWVHIHFVGFVMRCSITVLLKDLLEGVSSVAFIYIQLLLMSRCNRTESDIFIRSVIFLLPMDILFFRTYLNYVSPQCACGKSPLAWKPVHCIFFFFFFLMVKHF